MMVTLKKLASTGCTLIFTIYQSSTEVFGLFDRICLLSNGNTLFFGETLACLQVRDAGNFVSFSNEEHNVEISETHIIWPFYCLVSNVFNQVLWYLFCASFGCHKIWYQNNFSYAQNSKNFFFLGIKDCVILILTDIFTLMKHFSNAGFPCPIMQSPSDHFLRAINTDFDRIIAMCKNWQVLE